MPLNKIQLIKQSLIKHQYNFLSKLRNMNIFHFLHLLFTFLCRINDSKSSSIYPLSIYPHLYLFLSSIFHNQFIPLLFIPLLFLSPPLFIIFLYLYSSSIYSPLKFIPIFYLFLSSIYTPPQFIASSIYSPCIYLLIYLSIPLHYLSSIYLFLSSIYPFCIYSPPLFISLLNLSRFHLFAPTIYSPPLFILLNYHSYIYPPPLFISLLYLSRL